MRKCGRGSTPSTRKRWRRTRHRKVGIEQRGHIYSGDGGGYGSKPRPVVVIQGDAFPTAKRLVALIGSPMEGSFPIRVPIQPDSSNNLRIVSTVMIDVIQVVRSHQFGVYVGRLQDEDMRRVDAALLQVLGFNVIE